MSLKKEIECIMGPIDEQTFRLALDMTTDDIKANRIGFNTYTYIENLMQILISSVRLLRRIM